MERLMRMARTHPSLGSASDYATQRFSVLTHPVRLLRLPRWPSTGKRNPVEPPLWVEGAPPCEPVTSPAGLGRPLREYLARRPTEFALLDEFVSGEPAVCTLSGPGGIGKTVLAVT